jgi:hypothetical protein
VVEERRMICSVEMMSQKGVNHGDVMKETDKGTEYFKNYRTINKVMQKMLMTFMRDHVIKKDEEKK